MASLGDHHDQAGIRGLQATPGRPRDQRQEGGGAEGGEDEEHEERGDQSGRHRQGTEWSNTEVRD